MDVDKRVEKEAGEINKKVEKEESREQRVESSQSVDQGPYPQARCLRA
jgi:hypothetical protein